MKKPTKLFPKWAYKIGDWISVPINIHGLPKYRSGRIESMPTDIDDVPTNEVALVVAVEAMDYRGPVVITIPKSHFAMA